MREPAEQSAEGAKVARRGLGRDLSVVPGEHSETLHTSAPEPKSISLWALHLLSLGVHHRAWRRSQCNRCWGRTGAAASEGEQHPLKLWLRALQGQGDGGVRGAQCSDEHSQLHGARFTLVSGSATRVEA